MTNASTYARCTDALNRLDEYAKGGIWGPDIEGHMLADDADLQVIRHLVEALDRVLRAYPGSADYLESFVADACAAVGVEGP
jgi:hypothetical protein